MANSNPYLQDQSNAITRTVTDNLQQTILPAINSQAVANGGYGGSRQGIAQGLAIGQTNQGLASALANLQSQGYQADQSYNLGLGALGLQNQQQNLNFYTQQRGLDQSGAQLGANLYSLGNQGVLGQGQGLYNLGTTQQQAPWTAVQNAGNVFSQFSGLGGSQSQTQSGNVLGGAIGGGLAGAQIGQNLGFGSNLGSSYGYVPPTAASTPNAGFGSGFYYGQQDLGGYF